VVVKLALNVLLVPLVGIAGAALSTLAALSVQAVVQSRFLPRRLGSESPSRRLVLACLLVCALAAATVLLPQTLGWNLARFGVGLACLPWFFARLSSLRNGPQPSRSRVARDQ
jgi:O-antigen/teichoic acid export membrane protein